jgi:arabinofuranosyltransferase
MQGITRRRWLILPVLLLLIFAIHATAYRFYAVDDAFISFRHAENWANGFGPVFNPGERVDGYTNFLWVVLLTITSLARIDTFFIAHLMGLWFGMLSLGLAAWLARRNLSAGGGLALVLTLGLLALNPTYTRSMVEGLETALFTFLMLASMALAWGETRRDRPAFPWSGLAAGLLMLTRPDGLLFVPLIGLWGAWRSRRRGAGWPVILRWAIGFLAIGGLLAGGWFAWHYLYYGALLPNTYYAKTDVDLMTRLARGADSGLKLWNLSGGVLMAGVVVLGLLFFAADAEWWALLLAVIAARVAFHLYSGGSVIGYLRFLTPAIPPLAALAAVSIAGIWQKRRQVSLLAPVPAAALLGTLLVIQTGLPNVVRWYNISVQQMAGLTQGHIALGKHLAEIAPPGASMAIQDAGAVPYYSGLPTIDIVGLNDAHIAHLPGDLYQKTDVPYVLAHKPTYIVLVSNEAPEKKFVPAKWVDIQFYDNPDFQAQYAFREAFLAGADYYLWVFERKP